MIEKMDCFECDNVGCEMKRDRYRGVQPCFYCVRAEEAVVADECLICIMGHACCFEFTDRAW